MAFIQFLGHAAFYIEGAGIKALIDPYLTGNQLASEGPEARKELDYIFVTHAHGDHLGDTIPIALRTGATVIATAELAAYLSGKGVKTHAMHLGGRAKFPFGTVKLTIAFHGSRIVENGALVCSDSPCGFLIELDGAKIYHSGDTGLTTEMTLLEAEGVDTALLPIGGNYVMDVDDAVRAVGFIKPRRVVPMHYGETPPPESSPVEFAKKVGDRAEAVILKPGESFKLR